MENIIYQIQITLKEFSPKIWRRLLILPNTLLSDFHETIQIVMGWDNYHLHQFIKNKTYYTVRMPNDDYWDEMGNVDYKKMIIKDLLKKEKEKIIYEYDFGDGWKHIITLEKILPIKKGVKYPICINGKMNCPPEDCGGVWGYADMLEKVKNPNDDEYEDIIEWLGGEFDSEYFNIDEVNKMLSKIVT